MRRIPVPSAIRCINIALLTAVVAWVAAESERPSPQTVKEPAEPRAKNEIHLAQSLFLQHRGGSIIVDARPKELFATGHIPGAISAADVNPVALRSAKAIIVYGGSRPTSLQKDISNVPVFVFPDYLREWTLAGFELSHAD